MSPSPALRLAAAVELASLAVLLVNLATGHRPEISAAVGPTHGCAYLFVVLLTALGTRDRWVRLTAAVPGVGGLLVLRRLRPERPRDPAGHESATPSRPGRRRA
jgi:hypothetical protein